MDEVRSKVIELAIKSEISDSKIKAALQVLQGNGDAVREPDKFMSVKETCNYLAGISRVHCWQLRKRGMPSHKIGNRLGFKATEISEWLARNERKTGD